MSKYKILFVCMGNICRSPTAEGAFRSQVEKRNVEGLFEIDSAAHAGQINRRQTYSLIIANENLAAR